MATVIKIKNTDLNKAPVDGNGDSVLATGELAYSYYTGAQNNFGDRIFIGTGTEVSGSSFLSNGFACATGNLISNS